MPRRGNVLIGPSAAACTTVDRNSVVEAFRPQVVHQVIGVGRRRVARRTLRLAEEEGFSPPFCLVRHRRVEAPEHVQLRRWREVEQVLELAHEMHLAAALEGIDAFARGARAVAVEVGGALLELGEILDALQRPL